MCRLFQITVLLFISFLGYAQKDKNEIVFTDSFGNTIESIDSYFVFKLNNRTDSIQLENLHSNDYFRRSNEVHSLSSPIDSVPRDSNSRSLFVQSYHSTDLKIKCRKEKVEIVDSIDLNQDGVKEMFLHRKWNCSSKPPVPKPYGIGSGWQAFSQYEVWDILSKERIFRVKNVSQGAVALSTNITKHYGYSFIVEIDENGSLFLSDLTGRNIEIEMGEYVFDIEVGRYKKGMN
ncbi:hypothetical protein [Brumimicrobium oceani]|uniref:Uncharacterized protein n=1 Tax=Brumimicrobium oceani TaxID=2100725 RepID=A0A2U2XDF2_9FLAO|nr:hypothetical protein [Brumimicrobium oceani]PWH85798.1 hypothetical protein DIT68_06810 [Brumimicrobium oceani]